MEVSMTRWIVLGSLVTATATLWAQAPAPRWWEHVRFLADDNMQGRDTGTESHRRAAEYVAGEVERAGIRPGGARGYLEPLPLRSRKILESNSSLGLVLTDGLVVAVSFW